MDIETIRKMTVREIVSNPDKYGVEIEDDTHYVLSDEIIDVIVAQLKTDTLYDNYDCEGTVISRVVYKRSYLAIVKDDDGYCIDFGTYFDCDYGHIDYDDGDHRNVAPSSEYISDGTIKDGYLDSEVLDVSLDETMDGIIDELKDNVINEVLESC